MSQRPAGPPLRRPRHTRAAVRRRRLLAVVVLALVVAAVSAGWRSRGGAASAADPAPAHPVTAASSPATTPATPVAGSVVQRGSGELVVVPGLSRAPGRGVVLSVRVEVEGGIGVAPQEFADVVLATLNDGRSWGHGGTRTFARTDGPADVRVVLASPDTSAALCRPLVTRGRLSCSLGDRAIITSHRWAVGTPEFTDLGVYRQYVVNHEVGHVLGQGHRSCGGAGSPAPVMQQQTIRVAPCTPNAWPFP